MTLRDRFAMIRAEITVVALFFLFTMLLLANGADTRVASAAGYTVAIGTAVAVVKFIWGRA